MFLKLCPYRVERANGCKCKKGTNFCEKHFMDVRPEDCKYCEEQGGLNIKTNHDKTGTEEKTG